MKVVKRKAARGKKQEAIHLEAKVLRLQKEGKEERMSGTMASGELTPPSTPGSDQTERKSRSPGAKVRSLARLLQFQEHLCKEHNLPLSQLQVRMGLEETTPSSTPPSSPSAPSSTCGRMVRDELDGGV